MTRRVTSLLLVVIGSLGVWAASESTAHAFLFPFCHGWGHGQTAYYPPAYCPPSYGQPAYCPPVACPPRTCYRPVWSPNPFTGFVAYVPDYSNPGCCPTACPTVCSPCGAACVTCPTGGVGGGSVPRTRIDEGAGDSGFRPTEEGGVPRTFLDNGTSDMTDSFKVPRTNNSGNPQPAPIRIPDDDSAGQPDGSSANGGAGEGANPAGNGTLRVPPLDVDHKVTWHVVTSRKRLFTRSRTPARHVSRARIDPNRDWTPLGDETRIVSK